MSFNIGHEIDEHTWVELDVDGVFPGLSKGSGGPPVEGIPCRGGTQRRGGCPAVRGIAFPFVGNDGISRGVTMKDQACMLLNIVEIFYLIRDQFSCMDFECNTHMHKGNFFNI